jgi:hypothetical protein
MSETPEFILESLQLRRKFAQEEGHVSIRLNHEELTQIIELVEKSARAMARVAKLKRELAMWRSEHDPCPFALENEQLKAENSKLAGRSQPWQAKRRGNDGESTSITEP